MSIAETRNHKRKSNLEDCHELIKRFPVKAEATVFKKNAESEVLYSSGEINEEISRDSIATVQDNNTVFKTTENELLSELSFPFTLQNSTEQYLLSVQGTSRPVNQAIIAIQETIPLIILGIVLLSTLCAVFYSRYITKPILELSRVSEKMAQLDFSVQSDIKRNDEIGVLSESLNDLSCNLANTLLPLMIRLITSRK